MPLVLPDSQRLKIAGRAPLLPPSLRVYAIGDIHGRADLLSDLLSQIERDRVRRPVARSLCVFLGDYIDRGTRSRETIDHLIEFGQTNESIFLKGNHEALALKCLSDRDQLDKWLRLGGLETLVSYGVAPELIVDARASVQLQVAFHKALPQSHLHFFRSLQLSFTCGDFFFVHAGVKPGIELSRQREADLLWIRQEFLSSNKDFGKIVVHGHTPTQDVEVQTNRINIDTGAFATGRLSSLVVDESLFSLIFTQ